MGYIAPITNYQYMQYAERVISKRYDPYTIIPTQSIRPSLRTEQYEHPNKQFQLYLDKSIQRHSSNKCKSANKQMLIDQFQGELTGKGQYFNEYA